MRSDPAQPAPKPICQCGYDLTGVRVEGRCPECGNWVWQPRAVPTSSLALLSGALGLLALVLFWTGPIGIAIGVVSIRVGTRACRSASGPVLAICGIGLSVLGIIAGLILVSVVVLGFVV